MEVVAKQFGLFPSLQVVKSGNSGVLESFCKVTKKHSNPTCMCHMQFKSQIRKENACPVLLPLSPTASFHALVSLLPANATLTAKVMAVIHSLEQHSQLYLASSWRCARCLRFRAIRGAQGGHILPARGMSPTRAAALSLIYEGCSLVGKDR